MCQSGSMNHNAAEERAVAEQQMVLLMEAMLEKEIIRFRAYAWCFGMVDMFVTSDLFAEKEFVLSVYEDDWNGGPSKCVAEELAKTGAEGKIEFVPLTRE